MILKSMSLPNHFWGDIKTSALSDVRLHANDVLHRWFPLLDEFFGYKFFEDKERNATVSTEHGFYEIKFKISPFSSKEIKAKVIRRNTISIEGRHREKQEQDQEISEYLLKEFVIPEDYNVAKTKCELAGDILTVIVPKLEHDILIKNVNINQSKKKHASKL